MAENFIPTSSIDYINRAANDITKSLVSSLIKRYGKEIDAGIRAGLSSDDIAKQLKKNDSKIKSKSIANTVARTALHGVYNRGAIMDMIDDEAIVAFKFNAIMDSRVSDICQALNGKIISKDEVLRYIPPLHYNCRSVLEPIFFNEIIPPDKLIDKNTYKTKEYKETIEPLLKKQEEFLKYQHEDIKKIIEESKEVIKEEPKEKVSESEKLIEEKLKNTVYEIDNKVINNVDDIFNALKEKHIIDLDRETNLKELETCLISNKIESKVFYDYINFLVKLVNNDNSIDTSINVKYYKDDNLLNIDINNGSNIISRYLSFTTNTVEHAYQIRRKKPILKHFGAQVTLVEQIYHYKKLFNNEEVKIITRPGLSHGELVWSKLGFKRDLEPTHEVIESKIKAKFMFDVLNGWNFKADIVNKEVVVKPQKSKKKSDPPSTIYIDNDIYKNIPDKKISNEILPQVLFMQELLDNVKKIKSLTELYNITIDDFKNVKNIKLNKATKNSIYNSISELIAYGFMIKGNGEGIFDASNMNTESMNNLKISMQKNVNERQSEITSHLFGTIVPESKEK